MSEESKPKKSKATKVVSLNDKYSELTAEFPTESIKPVPGAANLTSIKPQYIIERLNEVVGLGNWQHGATLANSAGYQEVDAGVFYFGTLHVRDGETFTQQHSVGFCARHIDRAKKFEKNMGDMYKAAKTDSLSKAASLFGIGNSVFKGLVDAKPKSSVKSSTGGDF